MSDAEAQPQAAVDKPEQPEHVLPGVPLTGEELVPSEDYSGTEQSEPRVP